MNLSIEVYVVPKRVHWIEAEAFTGLRPASHFLTAQKVTKNASRRAHAGSASCLTGALRFSPNAGRHQLGHPCPQTVVPCSRIRLRCSACFTARCCTRPRIHALRLRFPASSHHIMLLSVPPLRCTWMCSEGLEPTGDRKSTRLNSSH